MYLTSYFTSPNQPQLLAQLRACEWGAAKFLTELLEKEQFHHTLGAGDCYFLMAVDQIAAFATLTDRDCVDAPELINLVAFVMKTGQKSSASCTPSPRTVISELPESCCTNWRKSPDRMGKTASISRPTTRMCTKNTAAPIWTAGVTLTAKSAASTH